jgi:hypothetical protein
MTVSIVARGSALAVVLVTVVTVTPGAEAVAGPARPDALSEPISLGVTDNRPAASPALLARYPGFAVHDYLSSADPPDQAAATLDALHALARAGHPVTLTLSARTAHPAGFVAFVRAVVARDGSWLDAVEITNEPGLASPTSDGGNPEIVADLVQGVVTAKATARALGYPVQVGFDDVYTYGSPLDWLFWARLQAVAALVPAFRSSVDWLGLHVYPNFASLDLPALGLVDPIVRAAFASARGFLAGAGLAVPIRVTEIGYPTPLGPAEYGVQALYWTAVFLAVARYAASFGVTQLFVFMLQDSVSAGDLGFTGRFGLFDSRGVAKPAAAVVSAAAGLPPYLVSAGPRP